VDSPHDDFDREAAKGLDACAQLLEESLIVAVPELQVRILTQADRGRSKYEHVLQRKPVVLIAKGKKVLWEYSALHVMGVLGRRFRTDEFPRDEEHLLWIYQRAIGAARAALEQAQNG
jgi:hypothetical protein